jgi:prepilin-type N-terminal cleavage/methylation domain-containing protein
MTPIRSQRKTVRNSRGARRSGMTLVEMMITASLASLLLLGLITTMVFILRQNQLVESKMGANDQSRQAFDRMTLEIRKSKIFRIGDGTESSFAARSNGLPQIGNALQLSFTTDTNNYVRYFFQTDEARLCRLQSGVSGFTVVADGLTNEMFFQAESYLGGTNIVTDITYKHVIRTALHFKQFQYPLTQVGPGKFYDYYKMEFRVTPHNPDGA